MEDQVGVKAPGRPTITTFLPPIISVSGTFFGGKPLSKTTFGSLAPLAMAEAARGALFPMAGEEIQGMSQLKELRQKMSYIMDELSGKWLAASVHFAVCAAFCRRITQTNHGTTINDVAGETKGPSQRVLSHFNIIWVSWSRNVTDMLAKSANLSRRIWSNGLS